MADDVNRRSLALSLRTHAYIQILSPVRMRAVMAATSCCFFFLLPRPLAVRETLRLICNSRFQEGHLFFLFLFFFLNKIKLKYGFTFKTVTDEIKKFVLPTQNIYIYIFSYFSN